MPPLEKNKDITAAHEENQKKTNEIKEKTDSKKNFI